MSEKKKVVMKDWEIKKPKGFSAGYTISQIRKIESCFDSCDNLLHQIGLNLGYSSKRSKFINAIENISAIIDYVDEIVYEIVGTIDIPLRDSFNSGATETISRIHVEDIETSNTIGVKEAYGKYDSAKGVYVSGERVARKLKFKDFIGGGKVGGKYREKFIELFKEDYENISKSIKENDKNGVLSYDKYIEYLIKDGEFDHKVNQPFKSFVSGLLDLTIIKPIIEAYTGTDLITGEDLTDLERGLKGVGAVIDILTLGQAMTIAKGAEAGISKMLKTVAVEGLSNVAGYTAAEISNAYDMPPLVSMIVSLGAGITASKVGCKYIIKDSSGKVIQEISDEVARNIDNTSNTTSIKENILKNVEESRIAREASGYKSFIEFESGLTKGGSNPNIDIINNSEDWIKSLSKEEIDALYRYQSNDIYEKLNSGLRNGEVDEEFIEVIKNLDSAISKGILNNDVELYRGFTREDIIENWDRIINGKEFEFTDDGYVSTSMKPSVADNFAMLYDEDGIFAYMKVPNINGANINAISFIDEAEVLLERGLTYKITKAWEEDGYKYVIMEVSK